MSKLLKKYEELKKTNNEKIYLFETGIFYNSLNDDAKILSEKIGLKITTLGNDIVKCGFPKNSLDKYIKILKEKNIDYEIIEKNSLNHQTYSDNQIVSKIKNLNLTEMTPIQCFNFIYDLQKNLESRT